MSWVTLAGFWDRASACSVLEQVLFGQFLRFIRTTWGVFPGLGPVKGVELCLLSLHGVLLVPLGS